MSVGRRKGENVESVEVLLEEDIDGRSRKRRRIAGDRSKVQSTNPVKEGSDKSFL